MGHMKFIEVLTYLVQWVPTSRLPNVLLPHCTDQRLGSWHCSGKLFHCFRVERNILGDRVLTATRRCNENRTQLFSSICRANEMMFQSHVSLYIYIHIGSSHSIPISVSTLLKPTANLHIFQKKTRDSEQVLPIRKAWNKRAHHLRLHHFWVQRYQNIPTFFKNTSTSSWGAKRQTQHNTKKQQHKR